MVRVIVLCALVLSLFNFGARADEALKCPKRIAVISNDTLSAFAAQTLKDIYLELGCAIALDYLPGRRGIRNFNEKKVDGEIFRLEKAEALYSRPFVRSAPLFNLSNSLWANPIGEFQNQFPMGFILGVVWQEKYLTVMPKRAYHDSQKMFDAYNEGNIGSFLAADFTVLMKNRKGELSPKAVRSKKLFSEPLYHYLSEEFAPFMKRFSHYLEQHKPFLQLEAN